MKKTKFYTENGREYRITLDMRWDDECRNGHKTFSMSADIDEKRRNRWVEYSYGQCVDEMAKHFPEYAHLMKWHLVSEEGPRHYIGNATYFASDRDFCGKEKGKERDLDAARRCAIWPEATDEELSLPKEELTVLLKNRLPKLMEDFYADLKGIGLL